MQWKYLTFIFKFIPVFIPLNESLLRPRFPTYITNKDRNGQDVQIMSLKAAGSKIKVRTCNLITSIIKIA